MSLLALAACRSGGAPLTPPTPTTTTPTGERPSAAATSDEPGVTILRDAGHFVFERDGRLTSTWTQVARIETEAGAESWTSLSVQWAPWYEERPELRARVTTPDGRVLELDPKTIDDAPASDGDSMYQDRRVVRAPIPGVRVGAIVESSFVHREKRPYFEGGAYVGFGLGSDLPVERAELVVEVPEGIALRWRAHGATITPTERRAGDRVVYTFEGGPYTPFEALDPSVPSSLATYPHIELSVAPSWAVIGARYAELVDEQLRAPLDPELLANLPRGDRRATIRELRRRVHARVRYTGVELGDAAVVPRAPAETLKRGFGDCKDKATLLVALLRASGVEAHVALLRAGFDLDVSDDVPSLEAMNHAIVFVPGAEEYWIDATAEYFDVGEVPPSVQGRRVLIASRPGAALRTIPETTSRDDVYHEVREVTLPSFGAARIVERSWGRGTLANENRARAAESDKSMREALAPYAGDAYLVDAVSKVAFPTGPAPEHGTEMVIEIEGSSRGWVEESEAVVAIDHRPALARVPRELQGTKTSEGPRKKRHLDLEWWVAASTVIEYRVRPPLGFVVRAVPEPRTEQLGPAKLQVTHAVTPDGLFTARISFDPVKRRYSPDEVEAFRAAYARIFPDKLRLVYFDHLGTKALAEGRMQEGLRLLRGYQAQEPKVAVHAMRLASAYLEAGFGQAARTEAERAVALAPNDAETLFRLAWVLSHDELGRSERTPMDRARSLEMYRAAKRADPKLENVRRNLAVALEYSPDGKRYGPGADLDGAIAEYRACREDLETRDLDGNLMGALLRANRWEELRTFAESLEGEWARAYLVAATAVTQGITGATRALDGLPVGADEKAKAAQQAAGLLLGQREYPLAADLLSATAARAGRQLEVGALLQVLRKTKKREELPKSMTGPAATIASFFADLGRVPDEALKVYFSKRVFELGGTKAAKDALWTALTRTLTSQMEAKAASARMTLDFLLDATASSIEPRVEGDDATGYRVRMSSTLAEGRQGDDLFVVREDGRYVIAAAPQAPMLIGLFVLDRVEHGDLKAAKQWLTWYHELASSSRTLATPFPKVWSPDDPVTKESLRDAGAWLAATMSTDVRNIVPLLRDATLRANEERRPIVLAALARAYGVSKEFDKLVDVTRQLYEASPDEEVKLVSHAEALGQAGRAVEALKLLDTGARRHPDSTWLSIVKASVLARDLGDHAGAVVVLQREVDQGRADAMIHNNLAWNLVLEGKSPDRAIEHALKSASMDKYRHPASLHTLATAYAEAGRTAEAKEAFLRLVELRDGPPEPDDWYVYGRIAEEYGLVDVAKTAYARVAHSEHRRDGAALLAERRLKGLAAKTK
ncbi:DUF3857 domain-containing protein [Myxococcota bacterium]|nr:DUF3857 domain-containing protein [Myxococcota bacterium]